MKLTQHCIRHRRLLFMLDRLSRRIDYGAAYTELEAATAASKWGSRYCSSIDPTACPNFPQSKCASLISETEI
jgi:hypothetical protein